MTNLTAAGTPAAAPYDPAGTEFTSAVSEILADHDEDLLAPLVDAGTARGGPARPATARYRRHRHAGPVRARTR